MKHLILAFILAFSFTACKKEEKAKVKKVTKINLQGKWVVKSFDSKACSNKNEKCFQITPFKKDGCTFHLTGTMSFLVTHKADDADLGKAYIILKRIKTCNGKRVSDKIIFNTQKTYSQLDTQKVKQQLSMMLLPPPYSDLYDIKYSSGTLTLKQVAKKGKIKLITVIKLERR